MEEKVTFKKGRIVNAATLGKNKHSLEERRAINAAKPAGNKYIEAFRKFKGSCIVHDPAFML